MSDNIKVTINGQEIEIEGNGGQLNLKVEINEDGSFEVVPAEPEPVEE